jgi:peptidoglycan/LPS O-acetylase OafA/YrhL
VLSDYARNKIDTMKPVNTSDSSLRNANLDFLRGTAICLVVCYHLFVMSPIPLLRLLRYTHYGQYGVDLFFVLSGWLIGSLYWRELSRFGTVDLPRFWARRWIRTIPPYLVALTLSWLAVFKQRYEIFDLRYLLFVQNYYAHIPFFLISWSLCIEEHFYLIVPLALFVLPQRKVVMSGLFVILFLIAPISRYLGSLNGVALSDFAYMQTATHLRTEGLILGFAVAYFPIFLPAKFAVLTRYAPWIAMVAGLGFIACQFLPDVWNYRIEGTILSIGLTAGLLTLVSFPPNGLASSNIVRAIAIASYSAYLTHSLVLHVAKALVERLARDYWLIYFPFAITLVIIIAASFYWAIELTSIRCRDSWIPRHARKLDEGARVVGLTS